MRRLYIWSHSGSRSSLRFMRALAIEALEAYLNARNKSPSSFSTIPRANLGVMSRAGTLVFGLASVTLLLGAYLFGLFDVMMWSPFSSGPAVLSYRGALMPLEGISTLAMYTEDVSYFEECGFKHQPDQIEVCEGSRW